MRTHLQEKSQWRPSNFESELHKETNNMKRTFQKQLDQSSGIVFPASDSAIVAIQEQYLRLDPDEQRILLRILRQAERLDAALADLHLVLPTIEICFYGVSSGGRRLAPQSLRKLIQSWDTANQSTRCRESHE